MKGTIKEKYISKFEIFRNIKREFIYPFINSISTKDEIKIVLKNYQK